jgi:hypothetical protein
MLRYRICSWSCVLAVVVVVPLPKDMWRSSLPRFSPALWTGGGVPTLGLDCTNDPPLDRTAGAASRSCTHPYELRSHVVQAPLRVRVRWCVCVRRARDW